MGIVEEAMRDEKARDVLLEWFRGLEFANADGLSAYLDAWESGGRNGGMECHVDRPENIGFILLAMLRQEDADIYAWFSARLIDPLTHRKIIPYKVESAPVVPDATPTAGAEAGDWL